MNQRRKFPSRIFAVVIGVLMLTVLAPPAIAALAPDSGWLAQASAQTTPPELSEVTKYLLIGTTSSDTAKAVNVQNGELGADHIMLSDEINDNVDFDNQDVFGGGPSGSAPENWSEGDNSPTYGPGPGVSDYLTATSQLGTAVGAGGVFEGTDWSGNVALTSPSANFDMSNVEVYADMGVVAASSSPASSVSNSKYFADTVVPNPGNAPSNGAALPPSGLTSSATTEMAEVRSELDALEAFIRDMAPEVTLDDDDLDDSYDGGIEDQKLWVINVDQYDTNDDGFAIIDIKMDGTDFNITNVNLVIQGDGSTFAIFRILGDANLVLNQSTIVLGDGYTGGSTSSPVESIGAAFVKMTGYSDGNGGYNAGEPTDSSDTVLSFNDTVLNGVAFWDLIVFGNDSNNDPSGTAIGNANFDNGATELTVSNGQGCSQFIAPKINFNNVRWNRCSPSATCPGATVQATICHDLNANGLCETDEPRFVPDHPDALDIPVELIPVAGPVGNTLFGVTDSDGVATFVHPPDPFVVPAAHWLDVDDAQLFKLGYVPTSSDVKQIYAGICSTVKRDFGYIKTELGGVGDLFWYDTDKDFDQDEWFDANDDNQVTEYTSGSVPLPFEEWEWIDINGDGNYNLDKDGLLNNEDNDDVGELNKCGIAGAGITLFISNTVSIPPVWDPISTTTTNLLGYYRFFNLELDEQYRTVPTLDTTTTDAAAAWAATGLCKDIAGATGTNEWTPTVQAASSPVQASAVDAWQCYLVGPDGQTSIPLDENPDNIDLGLDFAIVCEQPLAVTLNNFQAAREGNTVSLAWETATESGVAGFNIYVETDGDMAQVNDALIASPVIDSITPTSYGYEAEIGGSQFYLELVSINGSVEMFGPFTAEAFTQPAAWLPFVTN